MTKCEERPSLGSKSFSEYHTKTMTKDRKRPSLGSKAPSEYPTKTTTKSKRDSLGSTASSARSVWSSIDWDEASDQDAVPSRYDPTSIKCIGDINNLVDEESDDESPAPDAPPATAWTYLRRSLALVAVAGIIVGAGAGIGTLVSDGGLDAQRIAALWVAEPAQDAPAQDPQRLLDIAERVVWACDYARLYEDATDCEDLCQGNLCCVDGEAGESSCEDSDGREGDASECAVYAGCEVLLESKTLPEQ